MKKLNFFNRINAQLWIPVLIFILLFSVSRFYGLEEHPAYWGMAYSIIHPQHFTIGLDTSEYIVPRAAVLYTFLVKLAGPLWLDDRFCLFVYFLFALAAFIGTVRIILLWTGKNVLAVLTVLGIATAFHQFISNVAQILEQGSFRPSAFTHPFVIWGIYFILRKSWGKAALMMVLANAMFVKEAWFPALAGLCFLLKDRYHLRWPVIASGIGIAFFIFLGGNYWYQMSHGALWENARVFDMAHAWESGEGDPSMDGFGPVVYLLLIILCWRVRFPDGEVTTFIRRLSCLSGIVYILGAVYLNCAPDALKVPFFVAIDVTRSTWLPQLMMFIFLASFLVRKIDFTSLKKSFWAWAGLIILYVFPVLDLFFWKFFFNKNSNHYPKGQPFIYPEILNKCIMLMVLILVLAAIYFIRQKRGLKKGNVVMLVFIPIIVLSFASHLNKLHQRSSAMNFLFHNGIVGDSASAKWAHINEYVRQSISPRSTVMAFSYNGKGEMSLDQSLRVRTGRLSGRPIGYSGYFDYKKSQRIDALCSNTDRFFLALSACDAVGVKRTVKLVPMPDYMIVPADYHCDLKGLLGYSKIKEIDAFVILKKDSKLHPYNGIGPQ